MLMSTEHQRRYSLRDVPTYPGTLRGYRQWGFRHYDQDQILFSSRVVYDGPYDFGVPADGFDVTHEVIHRQRVIAWRAGVNKALCYAQHLPITIEIKRRDEYGSIFMKRETIGFAVRSEGNPLHSAPYMACACGLYALHNKDVLNEHDGLLHYGGQSVFGSIKASGRVLIGRNGFRAQSAEIEALSPSPHCMTSAERRASIRRIAEAYSVPYFHSATELMEVFPPSTIDLEAIPGGVSTS